MKSPTEIHTSEDDQEIAHHASIADGGQHPNTKTHTKRKSVARQSDAAPAGGRDAFVLSQQDMQILDDLKQKCTSVGLDVKKAQLLSIGLHLLASMPMGKLLAVTGPLELRDGKPAFKKQKQRPI